MSFKYYFMENRLKKEVRRSNAYPSITLDEALDLTEFVYKNSGHSYIKLEDIASLMKKSVGGISQRIGSAVQYNLLELKSGTGYRPSDLFKKIYKPISQNEKHQNLVDAFNSPKLYVELINKYEGSILPSDVILPNILERDHSIYDDAARKASQVFLENVKTLGLLNSANEFSINNANSNNDNKHEEKKEEVNSKSEAKNPISRPTPNTQDDNTNLDLLKIEIGLSNNKKAVIFYPKDMTNLDVEIIKLQVSVLEKIVEFKIKPE